MSEWIVYMIECADNTLYTGITNRLEHRLQAHHRGTASRYTRGRRPVTLVYREPHPSRSSALKRERIIKDMPRSDKRDLIAGYRDQAR